MESCFRWMFQRCLAIKQLLLTWISSKPKSPSFFGRQTDFQATIRADLLLQVSPVHKKFLQRQVICLITARDIGKILTQNWTIPYNTDLISSSLPEYERCLPSQPWIAASSLCMRGEYWLASSLWGLRGTPRYLKGKTPIENPVSAKIDCCKRSVTPPKYIDDLEIFIFRPDVCPKSINCWRSTWTEFLSLYSINLDCRLCDHHEVPSVIPYTKHHMKYLSSRTKTNHGNYINIVIWYNIKEFYIFEKTW